MLNGNGIPISMRICSPPTWNAPPPFPPGPVGPNPLADMGRGSKPETITSEFKRNLKYQLTAID